MTFKSVEKTFIYGHLNQSKGLISNGILQALKEGTVLSKENMEEAFIIINKNFKYPLKHKIMEEVEQNKIVMIFSPPKVRVPNCIPFFLTKNKHGDVVSVVLVDTYGRMNEETKNITIDPKKLYCMLEGAYMAKLYYNHHREISKRNIMITNGSSIYANMFARVLNKRYALNIDKSKYHKVIFLASKFYLINILGLEDNEMVNNYAVRNCVGGNPYTLKQLNDVVDTKAFSDISSFIQELARPDLGMGLTGLTVRSYLEQFINMYDSANLLSLEYFPYFIYNVISVTNGAYINNQYILEDIVERHGPKMYMDLISI